MLALLRLPLTVGVERIGDGRDHGDGADRFLGLRGAVRVSVTFACLLDGKLITVEVDIRPSQAKRFTDT